MNQLDRLKEEEAAAEAQMLGNQTPPADPEVPAAPQQPEEPEVSATDLDTGRTPEELEADETMGDIIVPPSSEQPAEPEEYTGASQPQKPKRTNWKKRFTNYKASTDATINGLRKDLLDMEARMTSVLELNSQLSQRASEQEVQGDLFEGAFTQEDEDTFGSDGLDVVKKAAQVAIERQVQPLKQELKRQEEQRIKDARAATQNKVNAEYQGFLSKLETLVPEYAELNADPDYVHWLQKPDEFSGYSRMDLFRKAEASRDVMRVADFFMQYQGEKSAVSAQPSGIPEEMEQHVTPVGSGGGGAASPQQANEQDQGYYRKSDIDKFYRDMTKGRYNGQQDVITATEAAIEQAYAAGRVLHNE